MTKKDKLKKAILSGKIKNEKDALLFVLKEKEKEELIKEVIAEIPQVKPVPGPRGPRGEVGETGPAGRDGLNGRNGKDGETPVIPIDKIVSQAKNKALEQLLPKIPTTEQVAKLLPQRGDLVRNSLELLEGKERLRREAIDGLDNYPEVVEFVKNPKIGGGSTARNFYQLYDAPQSYVGQAGKAVKVKTDETGLEFYTISSYLSETEADLLYLKISGTTTGATTQAQVFDKGITSNDDITLKKDKWIYLDG